ncbi:adenosine deaminase-like [Stegodyphus dumicola]|uniref:adenosine deaminase-like n=1 Tax=Stegodyphus dumicola TaxID=202533 RepID=UPI0015AC283D|nr:adenosine deaminase-like [Stegodyphus dumicola]
MACLVKEPSTLKNFLSPFLIFLPVMTGDVDAIERMAYEFCEDASKEGILYAEARYAPHELSTTQCDSPLPTARTVSPSDVVEHVNKGLSRGCEKFGIKVRSILCCIRGRSEWSEDVLRLCAEYKNDGVVGIDIAGDAEANTHTSDKDIAIFKKAASMSIHRTAHAGEDGPASQVKFSLEELLVERIGHGYHVVDDPEIYSQCLKSGVHFETCPLSSILTGAVSLNDDTKHPIVRFAEDGANFSISRDDPTLIQRSLDDDYEFLRCLGLEEKHFIKANFNAARSSFLPEEEKKDLLEQLRIAYNIQKDEY